MDVIICFIVGFALGKLINYINEKKTFANVNRPKTLNIGAGDSNDVIKVTSGTMVFEVNNPSDINSFDLEKMDNVVFYISSTDKYILYKDKDLRYVKLDIPLR